jgi:hypothetical protein
MPAYAQDDTKKVFWDEAEKLDRKYAIYGDDRPNAPKEKIELARKNVNELAKAAKIQIGSNAYKELEKTLYTTDYIERKNIIAKSLAIRNNVQGTANWDKSPRLVNETIVGIDGKVKDWAKSQLYLQEEKNSKGEELYRVTTAVEVQAQMAAANAEKTKQKIITHHNNRFKSASPPDKYSTNKAKANPKTE